MSQAARFASDVANTAEDVWRASEGHPDAATFVRAVAARLAEMLAGDDDTDDGQNDPGVFTHQPGG